MNTVLDTVKDLYDGYAQWKAYGDVTSLMLVLSTMADWLPNVAALLSILWVLIRIYETQTIQCWIHGRFCPTDKD